MGKRRVILCVFLLMFGLAPLWNGLSNPRLAGLHGSDFLQLIASGLCFGFGFGFGVLFAGRKLPGE